MSLGQYFIKVPFRHFQKGAGGPIVKLSAVPLPARILTYLFQNGLGLQAIVVNVVSPYQEPAKYSVTS